MKPGHKILWCCGSVESGDFSHRLLLVRHSGACDSWRWYLYAEATGALVASASAETGISQAERGGQLAALRNGVSPILSNELQFAA